MQRLSPEDNLRRLGLSLPPPPPALANYELAVRTGSTLFLAGHAPLRDGKLDYVGKVGRELDRGRVRRSLIRQNSSFALSSGLASLERAATH
jgi:hypothetical protein